MSHWRETSGNIAFCQSRPRAYTLLELIIVLTILASLSAIAWPRVGLALRRSQQREAALQLKSEFSEARERAIREGAVWVFRYCPGTSQYLFHRLQNHTRPTMPASVEQTLLSDIELTEPPRQLPNELVFRPPTASARQGSAAVPWKVAEVGEPTTSNWVFGAEFLPDGRATETVVELLQRDTRRSIQLRLRGLTGGVTISSEQRATKVDDVPHGAVAVSQTESPS